MPTQPLINNTEDEPCRRYALFVPTHDMEKEDQIHRGQVTYPMYRSCWGIQKMICIKTPLPLCYRYRLVYLEEICSHLLCSQMMIKGNIPFHKINIQPGHTAFDISRADQGIFKRGHKHILRRKVVAPGYTHSLGPCFCERGGPFLSLKGHWTIFWNFIFGWISFIM